MKSLIGVALIFVLGLSPVVVGAESSEPADSQTGSALFQWCKETLEPYSEDRYNFGVGLCLGFIQGIHFLGEDLSPELERLFKYCPPKGVTTEQLTRVIVDERGHFNRNLRFRTFADATKAKSQFSSSQSSIEILILRRVLQQIFPYFSAF